MKAKVIHMIIDHVKDEGILEEGDIIRIEVEGHPIEKVTKIEGIQEEEDPQIIDNGGPPDDGGPPGDGGPPDERTP